MRIYQYLVSSPKPVKISVIAIDGMYWKQNVDVEKGEAALVKSALGQARDSNSNNLSSIALLLEAEDFTYYTGGDLDKAAEISIASSLKSTGRIISAMKLSHHGGDTSTPDELLQQCAEYAVAIVPAGLNAHEHPRKETMTRLIRRNCESNHGILGVMTGLLDRAALYNKSGLNTYSPRTILTRY